MIHLFQRGNTWWYSFTLRGKRIRQSTGERDKKLARLAALRAWDKMKDSGIDSLLHKSPTLAVFSEEFLNWVGSSHSIEESTKRYYRHGWKMLSETKLAGMRLDEIKNLNCEVTTFPGNGSTANQALRTLRRMFGMAVEMRRLYGEVPKIRLRKEWPRSLAMSLNDVEKIGAHMKGDPRDALIILRATGMRPKELFAGRWEFVRWSDSLYANPRGKTSTARRLVPLLGDSVGILKRRHLEQGGPTQGWIFPSNSKCGHMVGISKSFRVARRAAGLPEGLVLYTARHGFLSDLATVVSLKSVMELGGHSNVQTALRYQHPNVAEIQAKLTAVRTVGLMQ